MINDRKASAPSLAIRILDQMQRRSMAWLSVIH